MRTLLIIIDILLFVSLVVLSATNLKRPNISIFEQKKRQKTDKDILAIKNYKLYNAIKNILYVIIATVIVVVTMALIPGFKGFVSALAIIYIAYLFSKINYIQKVFQTLFAKPQEKILLFINKNHKWLNYFVLEENDSNDLPAISSEEELEYVLNEKSDFLSSEKKSILLKGLSFNDKTVKQIMVRRPDIVTIKGSELLGPLTLDKLYKSNQDYVLVIGKNIDEVKGFLPLNELLTIESGESSSETAIKAAKKPPYFVSQSSSLKVALEKMMNENQTVLVVTDKNDNTVGLLTLKMLLQEII